MGSSDVGNAAHRMSDEAMQRPNRNIPRYHRQGGLTIVELMVTLAVAAILIGLAVPAFNNFIIQRGLTAETNDFMVAVQYARSEAGRRGSNVSVQAQNAGDNANEWGGCNGDRCGWCVVVGDPGACPNDGSELRNFMASGNNTLNGVGAMDGVGTLTFNARGLPINPVNGSFELCHAGTAAGRTISITAIGRVSAQTKTDCP
jgi:type IV fimbrial biogenesis protein FimT